MSQIPSQPVRPPSLVEATGTVGPVLRLAWPVLVEQLLVMMVGLVDLWLTGKYLLPPHLAAIGLMSYVLWLIPCMYGIVAIGALALIARYVGRGDHEKASLVANQAMLAGTILAASITMLVWLGAGPFISLIRLPADSVALAEQYMATITPILPLMMVQIVGIACLRGAGDTFSGFATMALVNVVNITVGASLVIGWGPVPRLGWPGLAIGTACGYATGGSVVFLLLARGRWGLRLRWSDFSWDRDLMRRMLKVGLPGGIDQTAVVCCHLWFLSIINSLGTLPAAAHGLAVRIESLAYLPGTAFQVAAATMAGQYLGAGDRRRAMRSVLLSLFIGGGLMMTAAILFFFGGHVLTGVFLGQNTAETAKLTVPLLRIVAVAMAPFAVSMILVGGLRGAGDTRWPLLFTIIGFVMVRIPLAYILAWDRVVIPGLDIVIPGFSLGVIGAWYAMCTDVTLRSFLVSWRFLHGGWQRGAGTDFF